MNFLQTKSPLFNPVHPDVPAGRWEGMGSEEEVRIRNGKIFINGWSIVSLLKMEYAAALFHKHMHCIRCKPAHFIQAHLNIRVKPARNYSCREKLGERRKSSA